MDDPLAAGQSSVRVVDLLDDTPPDPSRNRLHKILKKAV
jgi:hypothetical protein